MSDLAEAAPPNGHKPGLRNLINQLRKLLHFLRVADMEEELNAVIARLEARQRNFAAEMDSFRTNLDLLRTDLDTINKKDEPAHAETVDTLYLATPQHLEPDTAPCPPPAMKLYGETDDQHLGSGRINYESIQRAVASAGTPIEEMHRVLELGCSNSRILRWFLPRARDGMEVWGVDIDAERLLWSDHTFGPAIRYSVTNPDPPLPFMEQYFDLVFAASVFTHIDVNYMAWFNEVRRILRPGGLAWITIGDEVSADIMRKLEGNHFVSAMRNSTRFDEFIETEYARFAVGAGEHRNVFYRREWLLDRLAPLFTVLGVEERAYAGFQTALLLRRHN